MLDLRTLALLTCSLLCYRAPLLAAEQLGVIVPDGFEVSLYADDELAHDIYSMTIDSQGRVVVAGADYVKTLHDDNGDGRADRATLFSVVPASGAHGMVFDGADLICTGDNSVMRLRDVNGDGAADGPPEVWTTLRHSEHGANGLVRGPDGCFYLICGNDAGLSEQQVTADNSPVRHPRCGGVARFSSQGKPLDVIAHGFRNPYDLDFDAAGRLLAVDSDGERDHHLPWYAPTRLFDIAQGMEHGWLLAGHSRSWNRPPSFFDSVERVVEIGRGSPTGAVVYRHRSFPVHYRGGMFSACWTLGRVYCFPLVPAGATVSTKLEVFMQTAGDVGFAPCDLAVGPQGDLFVAIGGRHTRGSVFRVRAVDDPPQDLHGGDPLLQVLAADQPLSSWSRARWVPLAERMGRLPFDRAIENESLSPALRVRALEILVELFGGIDAEQAPRVALSREPAVRARLAWALANSRSALPFTHLLALLTADADPQVARASWEALAEIGDIEPTLPIQPDWSRGLGSSVRRVRAAAIAVARRGGRASYGEFAARYPSLLTEPEARLAQLWIDEPYSAIDPDRIGFTPDDFRICQECFAAAGSKTQLQLEAVRLLQLGLGDLSIAPGQADVYSGYAGNLVSQLDDATRTAIVRQLAGRFPSADAALNREIARVLGMLAADESRFSMALTRQWTARSSVEDDLHYLIVASLLSGPRSAEITLATAHCLLGLHRKLDDSGQFASRNWPQRVAEVFEQLCQRNPSLAQVVVQNAQFGHVEHTLFVTSLPKELRQRATRQLWATTVGKELEASPSLVALVGLLPEDEGVPLLVAQWDHVGLRDSIVLVLAKHPRAEDRGKLIEALASPQPAVVEKAAQALLAFGIDSDPAEMAAALRALKLACAVPKQTEPRNSLLRLLDFWTEGCADLDDESDPAKAYVPWFKLFGQYYPHEAAKLKNTSGADTQHWRQRLAGIDWAAGQAGQGRTVFERRACHRCHQNSGHLGPELKGAVSRLSREDLFVAIVEPNLEVAPAFQTTVIATPAGQVYHGLIVYESPEGTLLQTGPDTTVRITDAEQSSVRKSGQSLMPTGLLDPLTDQELSDLYAFLRTLGSN